MDVHQAMDLEESLIAGGSHSIFMTELGGRSFWSELLLMSNGFERDELRHTIATFNRMCGSDRTSAELARDADYQKLVSILKKRPLPDAPGSELYRTPEASAAVNASSLSVDA